MNMPNANLSGSKRRQNLNKSSTLSLAETFPRREKNNHRNDHKLLQLQNAILEKIVEGEKLSSTLHLLCVEIEKIIPNSCCSIQLWDHEADTLHPPIAPNMPQGFFNTIKTLQGKHGPPPWHDAITRQQLIVSLDTPSNPSWAPIRDLADQYGLRAIWVVPILSQPHDLVGLLTILHWRSRQPTSFDHHVLKIAAHLALLACTRKTEIANFIQTKDRYQDLFESAPIPYFSCTIQGHIIEANAAFCELVGKPQKDMCGQSLHLFFSDTLRGRKKAELIQQGLEHGLEVEREELELVGPDGSRRWVSLTARLIRDTLGHPIEFRGILEDISKRKQAEQLIEGQKSILEMIAQGQPISHTLHRLCQTIETLSPDIQCVIHQLKGKTLYFLAGPSLPNPYLKQVETITIGPAVGSCGTAAYRREPVFVSDISTDPLWNKDRKSALEYGLKSCWSIPIFSSDHVLLGTLSLYGSHPRPPRGLEWEIIETSKKLAAIALEQNRNRAALKQGEARLRQVIDLVPHFIFAKDEEGRFILANNATAQVYGTTVQELLGKKDEDFSCSQTEAEHFRREDMAVISSGKPKEIEETITDSYGNLRQLHTTKIPFTFSDSPLPAILGVAIDITDRKRSEEALRLTQHVFDILPDHVAVIGPDYRYRKVNTAYVKDHGIPSEKLIGKHIADLFGRDIFLKYFKPHIDSCLAGESVSYEQWFPFQEWLPFKDGQERFMSVTYSPLQSSEEPDHTIAVVLTARDLTPRKKMEEALKESKEALRILLEERTQISQDLHDQVLQSMYAIGLIIAATRKPLEQQHFSEVHALLDQAVTLVNRSIVDLRRYIEGLPHQVSDNVDFVQELSKLIKTMTLPDGPSFEMHIDKQAVPFLHKQECLHLLNIAREAMSNCLRHAQASHGKVSLTVKHNHVQFEIRDNGKGFHYKTRSHQGHGLTNIKTRAEHIHGELLVRSGPQLGTRIIIRLPVTTPTGGYHT